MGETAAQLGPGTGLGLYSALGGGDGNLRQPLVRSLNLPWRSQAQDPTLFFIYFYFLKFYLIPHCFTYCLYIRKINSLFFIYGMSPVIVLHQFIAIPFGFEMYETILLDKV